jgi:hypothetical protein
MRVLDVLTVFIAGGVVGVLVQRARNTTARLQVSMGMQWALTLILAGPGVQAAARLLDAGSDIQFAAGVFRTAALIAAVIIYLRSDAPKAVDAQRR